MRLEEVRKRREAAKVKAQGAQMAGVRTPVQSCRTPSQVGSSSSSSSSSSRMMAAVRAQQRSRAGHAQCTLEDEAGWAGATLRLPTIDQAAPTRGLLQARASLWACKADVNDPSA